MIGFTEMAIQKHISPKYTYFN